MVSSSSFWQIAFPHQLQMHFMPIVRFSRVKRLDHWEVIGYEALVRGPHKTSLHRPDVLFALASALGRKRELELWCVSAALEEWASLPPGARMFVNIGVEALVSPELEAILTASASRLDPRRVVLELLEGAIPCFAGLRQAMSRISRLGYQFAIDDIGGSGSGVSRMVEIGPVDFLKIDRRFLPNIWSRDIGRARGWLQGIRETARVTGAQIVLEGIEASYLEALPELHRLGICLGQGYLFGQAARLERPPGRSASEACAQ